MVILSVYTIKKSYTPLVAYLVCDPYTVKFLAEIHSTIFFLFRKLCINSSAHVTNLMAD